MPPHDTHQRYVELFKKHTDEIDPLQHVILSGHLIIETALNNIVSLIFFHPEHIEEGRFRFEQKVRMARAFALRKDQDNVWDLIFAINSLRNDIAHNLTGEKRKSRMERVRDLLLVQPPLSGAIAVKKGSDEEVARYACAFCTGFLASLESDTRSLRRYINSLDAVLNPNEM